MERIVTFSEGEWRKMCYLINELRINVHTVPDCPSKFDSQRIIANLEKLIGTGPREVPFEECAIYFEDAEDVEYIKADRDNYKRKFDEFCTLTHRLKDTLLGPNWYVTDSCGEPQCSEIIIDEIIAKYGKAEKPKNKGLFWRK